MGERSLTIRGMVYASLFGAITAAGAYLIIPFPLVPITLQTLFLNLAAALLGGRLGALSQVIYLLLGIIGLPVFAGGKAGIGVLIGPTGGYLIGFVVASYVIGRLIEMKERAGFIWMACSMVLGLVVIYLLGITQLSIVAKLTLKKALTVGVLPFLIGDALKIILATLITIKIRDKIKF
ncbi:MAG: biotin synthase [Nitrospira bacterium SG8_3]|nr:MAG: biotin synthase [Nitrospira bacterium SG8_3]